MSDEIERRLREAGHRLPGPSETDTLGARAAFIEAAPRPRRHAPRRRTLALALALAIAVGGAFGVGYAVAGSATKTTTVTKTKVVHEKAQLDAGPGFLPASGWDTVATGTTAPPQSPAAIAANVPLAAQDRQLTGPPAETARRLGPNGVLLYAMFGAASPQDRLPQGLLPLRLDDAKPANGFEGMPAVGSTRRLQVRVGATSIDVLVFFGSSSPSPGVLAAAREELGRLVVPACPAAEPLAEADVATAVRYLLSWLPAHYPGDAADVEGATGTGRLGAAMPRNGQAAFDCGTTVADRSVEVDVVLPRLAKVSASLSELTYFVARTADGWTVWERAR